MKTAVMMAAVLAGISSAQAVTTFSFASDTDPSHFTFAGSGGNVSNGTPAPVVTLTVGNGNNGESALTFDVEFRTNFSLDFLASVNQPGGTLHLYNIVGFDGQAPMFGFYVPGTNTPLLTATFDGGIFRNLGSEGAWGTGGDASASDITGQVTYTWFGASNANFGLVQGASSVGVDDVVFTLTDLQNAQTYTPGVSLGNNYPSTGWVSEGSYSGTANFVPTPGAIALLGLGGLAVGRRRR